MIQATLTRQNGPCPDGTLGLLEAPGLALVSLERPGLGLHPRIEPGAFVCVLSTHPREGVCYELQNVPGRTAILIHPANVMEQLLGCIALGMSPSSFDKDSLKPGLPSRPLPGITGSKQAVQILRDYMKDQPFTLTIKEK